MFLENILHIIVDFVKNNNNLGIGVVFLLAFGESLAFISLLLPATIILFALGALIGESGLPFMPFCFAAILGAFFGDWFSYLVGQHYQEQASELWPISRHKNLLLKGYQFFQRWGFFGVFIGRFFGPLRAFVPLVAGICRMPTRYFQVANIISAIIWGFGILAPGALGLRWLGTFFS